MQTTFSMDMLFKFKSAVPLMGIFASTCFFACSKSALEYDASGTFEAQEVIVSAEVPGKILTFAGEEGSTVKKDEVVATIDPTNLQLQKDQLEASMVAVREKTLDPNPQIGILEKQALAQSKMIEVQLEQQTSLHSEKARFEKLVKADAVNTKQLDDINSQLNILRKQIEASKSQLEVLLQQVKAQKQTAANQNRGVLSEQLPIEKKVAQIDDQIQRTEVKSPINGTILVKYAEAGEMAGMGKPLFKIASLDVLELRAYVTGTQLPGLKIGEKVTVWIDDADGEMKPYPATISWISDKAEFTPKTIMTKEERANLVYAIKAKVVNDGYLKIGMYGELSFDNPEKN